MSKRYIPLDRWLQAIREESDSRVAKLLLGKFRDEVEREYADDHSYLLLIAFAMGIFISWVFS